jgi:Protein of unknown function (DUF3606)
LTLINLQDRQRGNNENIDSYPAETAMSQQPSPFKPLDPGRVDTLDAEEMAYWCRELCCTMPQLEAAIAQVGEHVTALRTLLEQGKK